MTPAAMRTRIYQLEGDLRDSEAQLRAARLAAIVLNYRLDLDAQDRARQQARTGQDIHQ